MTLGVSPAALGMAYLDWMSHLASSRGKQMELAEKIGHKWARLSRYAARLAADPNCESCIEPPAYDKRFASDDWKKRPFNLVSQGVLLTQQWWHTATTGVRGVSPHHEAIVPQSAPCRRRAQGPWRLLQSRPSTFSMAYPAARF